PDNSPIYKSLSAQIDEEAIVFSKAESEYESLNSYYKGMPDDWDVKLTKEAALPTVPMGRPKGWYYMWGLLVVFLISVSGTVILEILDKKVHTREELQQQMSVPVIAEIDKAATGKKAGFLGVLFRKSNIFNPAGNPRLLRVYEQLFTFLKLEVFKGSIDKKIIMIASAEPDSGKTSVACNLALAAAKNGEKVLLIDADLRHPSVGEFFGLKSSEKGFSDILKGAASDKDVVRNLTDLLLTGSLKLDEAELRGFDNLKILLSGGKAANPLGLLEAKEVSELFKRLSQEYGMLVIDTAALRGYADGFNIVDAVDSLLLVTRRAGTPYPLLKSAISQIRKINGPLTGLVFNHV
ncbi:MAG: AAA family ATPase, partial [Candidatus Omnitrophica bacterium]|nr:AAA family ATPase [Candidatus Omnitrophota bacterium]